MNNRLILLLAASIPVAAASQVNSAGAPGDLMRGREFVAAADYRAAGVDVLIHSERFGVIADAIQAVGNSLHSRATVVSISGLWTMMRAIMPRLANTLPR